MNQFPMIDERRIWGRPYWYRPRPWGFYRPRPYWGYGPFFGGFLGGLVGSAIFNPYLYGGFPYGGFWY